MNTKPYKVIFGVLVLSVVFILLLQGFWIRNFYIQKQEEFSKTIYSALEKINLKLRERQDLTVIKQNFVYDPAFIKPYDLNGKPGFSARSTQIQVRNHQKEITEITAVDVNGLKGSMKKISRGDSVLKIVSSDSSLSISKVISKTGVKEEELKKLMNKMVAEIRINDNDERDPDTLKQIIKRVFETKGLFLPFEFALKKVFQDNDETLSKTEGFDEHQNSFISDLSSENVFSTHNFLFVQFPQQGRYVLSSIRNMLLLSILFSLIIISAFYYTIRLILNQKKLSEIKNDFVNNMTHELKTPIATNSLAIDALTNPLIKNDDEKFREYIRILKEENKKLNVHVERVLQMALLDKGSLPLSKKIFDVVPAIKSVIANYKLRVEEQKAEINLSTTSETIKVYGDEEHLQTVFSNLIDNALKYISEKCILSIHVFTRHGEVFITFKDNGIGIGREHHEKIFEKFYRAQGGNLHDVKGFGLGLSYVKSIVEAHQGAISVKSEIGMGSEFTVKLKLHE